jgi:hypothetical protein
MVHFGDSLKQLDAIIAKLEGGAPAPAAAAPAVAVAAAPAAAQARQT